LSVSPKGLAEDSQLGLRPHSPKTGRHKRHYGLVS